MTPAELAAARRGLTDRLIAALVGLFLDRDDWRDPAPFLAQAVPLVQGVQRTLAALVAAFVAGSLSSPDRQIPPPSIADRDVLGLRGVDYDEVYRRPYAALYTALSQGRSLTGSLELGRVRLAEIVEADLQQTYAHASRAAMREMPDADRPRFWRRVLVGEENCALCIVASTQRYTVEDLNPIHPGCDCTVAPLPGRRDPGQVIDPDLLERVHAAVEELTGESDRGARSVDYSNITISMIHEHGELGPMLARPRDRFAGPTDVRDPERAATDPETGDT